MVTLPDEQRSNMSTWPGFLSVSRQSNLRDGGDSPIRLRRCGKIEFHSSSTSLCLLRSALVKRRPDRPGAKSYFFFFPNFFFLQKLKSLSYFTTDLITMEAESQSIHTHSLVLRASTWQRSGCGGSPPITSLFTCLRINSNEQSSWWSEWRVVIRSLRPHLLILETILAHWCTGIWRVRWREDAVITERYCRCFQC